MLDFALFIKFRLFGISGMIGLFLILMGACQTPKPKEEEVINKRIDSLRNRQFAIKQERLDLILTMLYNKGLFNGNILVVEKNKILLKKCYGKANFASNTPLTYASSFRLGAISNGFTAMGIMILIEQGKLSLDDKLIKFFPKVYYPEITIRDLLNHTSGIPDYIASFYTNTHDIYTYANNRDVVAWLINDAPELNFLPRAKWEFSQTNYVLLAELIGMVSGKSYNEFMKKAIFEPATMQNAFVLDYKSHKKNPNQVSAYKADRENLNDDNFLNYIQGDDGIYASIEDLYQWNQILYTEKLVKNETLIEAFSPVKLKYGNIFPYGFGWHLKKENTTVFHKGGWLGFRSAMYRMLTDQSTIIILTNHSNPVFDEIVEMVYNILNNRTYKIPT